MGQSIPHRLAGLLRPFAQAALPMENQLGRHPVPQVASPPTALPLSSPGRVGSWSFLAEDSAESMAQRTTSSMEALQGSQLLLLPQEVVDSIHERARDVPTDPDWLNEWGICLGAAMAMGDDLVLLTSFRREILLDPDKIVFEKDETQDDEDFACPGSSSEED